MARLGGLGTGRLGQLGSGRLVATALQTTKLTMMTMTKTMAKGDDDDNGNGATGDVAKGYNNNGDG
jgi:hypothetical protein